jgi:hypothetical protein
MSLGATAVAAGNGVVVAASPGNILSSTDALHWRRRVWSDGQTSGANALTFAGGRFVAVGMNSVISVSQA